MMNAQLISKLIELDKLARDSAKNFSFKRELYNFLEASKAEIFQAIIGPRGVGKTVLLGQLRLKSKDALYISADTFSSDFDLFELVKILVL
jgi:predicted AAA+ superfamily ATPase